MMTRFPFALLALLAPGPALGGETLWQEVMPDVSIRLISADAVDAGNRVWIALEIDMPETINTYWRIPGESGIPPQFDFSGSAGIGEHEIAWPYPTRRENEAYLDHAYYGHTVLPIAIEVKGDAPVVELAAVLGICSEVCVPVSMDFTLRIDPGAPDHPNMLRIEQARAQVPIAWTGPDVIGDVVYDTGTGALVASLDDPAFPARTAIADIAGRMLLFGPPVAKEGALHFPLFGRPPSGLEEGETVHITFTGPDGPYEIVRPLGLGAPCAGSVTVC